MSICTNPVFVSVVALCVLCLCRLNVLLSLILSALLGAWMGGINPIDAMGILTNGFAGNAATALSYILLGTFATAIATTGLADMMSKKMSRYVGNSGKLFLIMLAIVSCPAENIIPVHIAFIPILIPPLLHLMNTLKVDRRAAACSLAFGLKATYLAIPFGYGTVFMGLVAKGMTDNGMPVTVMDVAKYNWMLGLAMLAGLLIAIFFTYSKGREYQDIAVDVSASESVSEEFTYQHKVTLVAIVTVVGVQLWTDSLPLASMSGLMVMFLLGAIKWSAIDDQFLGGVKIMGMIAFIMLAASGYADVIKKTDAVDALVQAAAGMMGGSKLVAATVITLIGLLVTMGIGSSFSTVPVTAVIYVPLCAKMGFSPAATIILLSAAAALGDAGSPASDTTLGPTAGLNADGQHDHIWDTCVPTFIHYNIPLMIAAIVLAQYL